MRIENEGIKFSIFPLTNDWPVPTNIATSVMESPRNLNAFQQFEFLRLFSFQIGTNAETVGKDVFTTARTIPVCVHKLIPRYHVLVG